LDPLHLRLALGSHLAQYLRLRLESEKGYTATVGISTNKLLSKLVGNTYKPNAQTTLVPPYTANGDDEEAKDNVTSFIDDHEVGKIPGIGFKIAQKLRANVLSRSTNFDDSLVYGGTKAAVRVHDVRTHPGVGPEMLERVLGGPGVPHGIGARIWGLLNGCDDTEVGQAREVPRQISIEDSYVRLDTLEEVVKELGMLAKKLIERMHTDLLEEEEDDQVSKDASLGPSTTLKRWLAHPKTIRLSTRPRPPQNPDGSRNRSFARISKSAPMPTFMFNLRDNSHVLVDKLLTQTLIPLFRQLHPEKKGWNLSLVNIAVTNMADAASEKGGVGRDISKMFKRQDEVLKQWKIEEEPVAGAEETMEDIQPSKSVLAEPAKKLEQDLRSTDVLRQSLGRGGSEDFSTPSQKDDTVIADDWGSEDDEIMNEDSFRCGECGAIMPTFAMGAHYRWHAQN
jgi:DNA polymerase iota